MLGELLQRLAGAAQRELEVDLRVLVAGIERDGVLEVSDRLDVERGPLVRVLRRLRRELEDAEQVEGARAMTTIRVGVRDRGQGEPRLGPVRPEQRVVRRVERAVPRVAPG